MREKNEVDWTHLVSRLHRPIRWSGSKFRQGEGGEKRKENSQEGLGHVPNRVEFLLHVSPGSTNDVLEYDDTGFVLQSIIQHTKEGCS